MAPLDVVGVPRLKGVLGNRLTTPRFARREKAIFDHEHRVLQDKR
ncbi:MAG: hypothetical protein WCB79_01870 [Halobacteriota archaeon]